MKYLLPFLLSTVVVAGAPGTPQLKTALQNDNYQICFTFDNGETTCHDLPSNCTSCPEPDCPETDYSPYLHRLAEVNIKLSQCQRDLRDCESRDPEVITETITVIEEAPLEFKPFWSWDIGVNPDGLEDFIGGIDWNFSPRWRVGVDVLYLNDGDISVSSPDNCYSFPYKTGWTWTPCTPTVHQDPDWRGFVSIGGRF